MTTTIESTLRLKAEATDGWIPPGSSVTVAGRDIGGMVYVRLPPMVKRFVNPQPSMAYIDPSLKVAKRSIQPQEESLSYWCGYSDLDPSSRANYLHWLESGRNDTTYHPTYMLLYFSGLERRFFCNPCKEEAAAILEEVRRLKTLYPKEYLTDKHLETFLDFSILSEIGYETIEPVFNENDLDELPFQLAFAIGVRIAKRENLNAEWLLSWLSCHPEGKLKELAFRYREEFVEMFRQLFNERYPDGLGYPKSRLPRLRASYKASSREFEGIAEFRCNRRLIPDISGVPLLLEVAQEIANEATKKLTRYSGFLNKNPSARGSEEALFKLPKELWGSFQTRKVTLLKSWANKIVDAGGMVPVNDVIRRTKNIVPQKKNFLGKLSLIADILASLGFGLTPDYRYAARTPKPEQSVMLFRLGGTGDRVERSWFIYRRVLLELTLGAFVVNGDDRIAEAERKLLQAHVNSVTDLSDQVRQRLYADLEWLLRVAPDKTITAKRISHFSQSLTPFFGYSENSLRVLLINSVLADGKFHAGQVARLEKVYALLKLDHSLVYADLHAGGVSDEANQDQTFQPGRLLQVQATSVPEQENGLDASRVAAIQSETEHVSSLLGDIFEVSAGQESNSDPVGEENCRLKGLDQRYGAFVINLLTQEHWPEGRFVELCKGYGMLPAGALEVVNEWAFDTFGDALLDEHEGFEVSPEVAESVRRSVI